MFEIKIQLLEDIPCLILKGRLDGLGADLFEKQTEKLHPNSFHWIVDFRNVDYMSSAGIRALLLREKELRNKGGKLILFDMDRDVAKVLRLTGLSKHFTVTSNREDAIAHISHMKKADGHKEEFTRQGCTYLCTGELKTNCSIDIWNNEKKSHTSRFDKSSLIQTNLKELGLSLGIGGFGNSSAQAQEGLGLLVSLTTAAGVSPADGYCRPDFLFTNTPIEVQLYIAQAISFSGEHSVMIKRESQDTITLGKLLETFSKYFESKMEETPPAFGFVCAADVETLHSSKIETKRDLFMHEFTACKTETDKKALIIGIYYDHKALSENDDLRPPPKEPATYFHHFKTVSKCVFIR